MRMLNLRRACGVVALVGIAFAIVTVEVWSASWVAATNISQTTPILQQDNVDVAVGPDEVVVAWAKGSPDYGLALSTKQGDAWATTNLSPPIIGQMIWSPSVAFNGSQLAAAWVEGSTRSTCTVGHKVRQYDQGGGSRTIMSNVFSPATAPDLAVGSSGWHMVFAAAASAGDCTSAKVDLYYTHRSAVGQPWSTPTAIITHSTVLAPGASVGGIWYPRVATLGTKVYVVWEQLQRYTTPTSVVDSDVWYIVGTMQSGQPVWSAPHKLSLAEHHDAVRPAIAVGPDGQVHALWTNLIGGRGLPDEQYVYYQRIGSSTTTAMNTEPLLVTGNFPTLAASSVAASSERVCAAWHGYTGATGSGREEITARCSFDNGATWQAPVNVSDSSTLLSIFPSMAVSSGNMMHFGWVEYQLVNNVPAPVGVFYRDSEEPDSRVLLPLVMKLR